MTCDGCGNENAYRMRFSSYGCTCNRCGDVRVYNPDVYFKGEYLDRNLVDPYKPEQKDGVWISSRAQKARIMEQLKVREAGDKRHGMRLEDKHSQRREQERGSGAK